jgi:hypothetical protein
MLKIVSTIAGWGERDSEEGINKKTGLEKPVHTLILLNEN